MTNIRIPTPDAPAAHHLAFICAVAELAHRVIENVTGLKIGLRVNIYDHINPKREPALVEAAKAAGLVYSESGHTRWYDWNSPRSSYAEVTVFVAPAPKTEQVLVPRCHEREGCEVDCPWRDTCQYSAGYVAAMDGELLEGRR